MRTFEELNKDEQEAAEEKAATELLRAISEGMRFNDKLNGDGLQARIDAACEEAEKMQTPWFAGEYIMEAAGDEIRGMARCDAEDAFYPATDERVIRLDK